MASEDQITIDSYLGNESNVDSYVTKNLDLQSSGFKTSVTLVSKIEERVVELGSAELELTDE